MGEVAEGDGLGLRGQLDDEIVLSSLLQQRQSAGQEEGLQGNVRVDERDAASCGAQAFSSCIEEFFFAELGDGGVGGVQVSGSEIVMGALDNGVEVEIAATQTKNL